MRSTARPALLALAAAAAACSAPASPLEARGPMEGGAAAPAGRSARASATAAAADAAHVADRILDAARRRGSLRLEDCVRLALVTHEDLLLLDEDVLQARLSRDLAVSGLLPEVSMQLRHERADPVTISTGGSPTSTEPARSAWSVNVFQPIFQGLRELHAIRSADRTGEALVEDRRDLRRRLSLSVARAFYLHAESEAEIRANEEALHRDEERVKEMEARAEEGLARRTEVLLQISSRETTRASLVEARQRRDASRVALSALVGSRVDLPLAAEDLPSDPPPSREDALAAALRGRPDLRAAERRMAAAAADRDAAGAGRWPTVAADANWYIDRWNHSEFAEKTRWDLELLLALPLYTGGEQQATERLASSRERQRALERAAVLRRVEEEVDGSLVRLAAGRERLESLRANERFARENLDLIQEEYRQGLATNLEVFTAQTQHLEAVVALERQSYQSRLDTLELDLATGRTDRAGVPAEDPAPKEKP